MKQINKSSVRAALGEIDLDLEDVLREEYQGRGGVEEGFGLVVENERIVREFFVELALFDADTALSLVRSARDDDMGTSHIVYFPGWELTE